MKINIEENDICEFIGEIIDVFEDFLDDRGIVLDNLDRDEQTEDDMAANIYGMDYNELATNIKNILNLWVDKDKEIC